MSPVPKQLIPGQSHSKMTSWRLGTCTLCWGPQPTRGHHLHTEWGLIKAVLRMAPIAGPTQPATSWPELLCPARGSCRRPEATGTEGPCSRKTAEASARPFLPHYLTSQLPSKNYGWSWGSLLLPTWRQTPIYPGRLIFPQVHFP